MFITFKNCFRPDSAPPHLTTAARDYAFIGKVTRRWDSISEIAGPHAFGFFLVGKGKAYAMKPDTFEKLKEAVTFSFEEELRYPHRRLRKRNKKDCSHVK